MKIFRDHKSFQFLVIVGWTCLWGMAIGIPTPAENGQATATATTEKPREIVPLNKPAPIAAEAAAYLSFGVNFIYRAQDEKNFQPLTPESILRSGDSYKIIFTPDRNVYVYIFQVDSSGKMVRLFPMKSFGGVTVNNFNPVTRGQTYHIPAENKSFFLDQQTGVETIYFLASAKPDQTLEASVQESAPPKTQETASSPEDAKLLELVNIAAQAQNEEVTVTPAADARKITWQETGLTFSVLQQRLEKLCDGCVYVIEFSHR